MDKWYIVISGLLLLLAAVLFIRLIQYKRQMRIFTNFFSNARKYADTRISVCLEQDTDGVSITFTNDIEADNEIDIDHVFDAFYRGNSCREEGAGLGLYVVKCLADKLGHVVSAEVKDKQFSVMLRIK